MEKYLDLDIQFLPGVGPKRAALLKRELEIATIGDLIRFYPFRYIDRSTIQTISSIVSESAYVQIQAEVKTSNFTGKRLSVIVSDGTGDLELVFFKGVKYNAERLQPGKTFVFFGKPTLFNGRYNMVHPEIDNADPDKPGVAGASMVMTGVYTSTEKLKTSGITGRGEVFSKSMISRSSVGCHEPSG